MKAFTLRLPARPLIYCHACGSSKDIAEMEALAKGAKNLMCCDQPPIAGAADVEYRTRIEAARVGAEFRVPITPTKPQQSIDDLPLFGGERQMEMF